MEKGIAAFRNYKYSSWKNGTKEISTDFITKLDDLKEVQAGFRSGARKGNDHFKREDMP